MEEVYINLLPILLLLLVLLI